MTIFKMIKSVNGNELITTIPVSNDNVFTESGALTLIFEDNPELRDNLEIIFEDYYFYPVEGKSGTIYFIDHITRSNIESYCKDNFLYKDKDLNEGGVCND